MREGVSLQAGGSRGWRTRDDAPVSGRAPPWTSASLTLLVRAEWLPAHLPSASPHSRGASAEPDWWKYSVQSDGGDETGAVECIVTCSVLVTLMFPSPQSQAGGGISPCGCSCGAEPDHNCALRAAACGTKYGGGESAVSQMSADGPRHSEADDRTFAEHSIAPHRPSRSHSGPAGQPPLRWHPPAGRRVITRPLLSAGYDKGGCAGSIAKSGRSRD
jgi:hypothetical protein